MNKLKINKNSFGTLLFVLLNVAWVTNAYADEFYATSPSGHLIRYETINNDDNTVRVVKNYNDDEMSYFGNVIIPSTVVYQNITYTVSEIGSYTFKDHSEMTGIEIPNTVTCIGWEAFYNCTGLTGTLTIGESIKRIDTGAFSNTNFSTLNYNAIRMCTNEFDDVCNYSAPGPDHNNQENGWLGGCTNLTTLNIGEHVEVIPSQVFAYCRFSGNLVIPNSVTTIGSESFFHCQQLTSVLIPESVIRIGINAFGFCTGLTTLDFNAAYYQGSTNCSHSGYPDMYGENGTWGSCHSLKTINIGENVTNIPPELFKNCYIEGDFVIPNSVATIGYDAFKGCSGITSLTIGEGVTSIGNAAFSDCTSLAAVNYDAINCNEAVGEVFKNCTSLAALSIGESVQLLPDGIFSNCSFSGSIIIPNSVKRMGGYNGTFSGCTNITSVTVGEGLTSNGGSSFKGCTNLSSVTYNAVNCSDFNNNNWENCTSLQTLTIGPKVQHLPANIFKKCSFTCELVLPNSLLTIENDAFSECTGFTGDLIIPENVTYIGANAFYGCTGFTGDLTIGNSVIQINAHAFDKCSGFTGALTIGESFEGVFNNWNEIFARCSGLTTLNYNAINANVDGFYWLTGCTSLTTLNIGPNVEVIPGGAFKDLNFSNEIIIPNSVTTIKNNAFSNCDNITSITIGENVTTMESSFTGCDNISVVNYNAINCNEGNTSIKSNWIDSKNNLTTLNIGGNVRKIFNGAFADMQFTGNLVLPNTLESIGEEAFKNCHSFTGDLVIPNSVTSIGKNAFYECSGFNGSLTIGDGVTLIDEQTFYKCSGFTGNLTIPNSVTSICNASFKDCSGFDGVLTIGKNVANIESPFENCGFTALVYNAIHANHHEYYNWWYGCKSLATLTIGSEVEVIPEKAFNDVRTFTGDLVIPNSVTTIGKQAFKSCSGFDGTLTLSSNVVTIDEQAFEDCTGFTGNLTLPASLEAIKASAFRYCHSFTGDLVIPEGVVTIGNYAFNDCYGMEGSLTIAPSVTYIGNESFRNTKFHTLNYNAVNATVDGNDWLRDCNMMITLHLGNQIQVIPDNAFHDKRFAGTLTLPNSLLAIGANAFYNCDYFTGNLVIPENVATIGNSAFRDCNGFNGTLTLPATMTSIGEAAFKDCRSIIGTLTIPEGITVIEKETFREMSSLTGDIVVPNSVVEIKNQAFINCRQFNGNLVLSSSLEIIGDEAFQDCYNLTGSLSLPNSLASIGAHAFRYCRGFTGDLVLPNSITNMGEGAFQECYGFNGELTLPNSIETLQKEVFRNCHGFVGSLVIPNSVTTIQNDAFKDCYGFDVQLIIGEMVDIIYYNAFENAKNFQSIMVKRNNPPTLASDNIFWYWDMTKPVYVPCGMVEAYASSGYWANFTNIQEFGCSTIEITALVNNPDYGTVTGAGFFADGEICTLTATPNTGYIFINWTENDVEVSADAEYSFTVENDRSLVANFAAASAGNHWNPDISLYSDNMSVVAEIHIDGAVQTSTDIEIGAFCGDEVRGSRRVEYKGTPFDKYVAFLTVYGESNDNITFKVYDHQNNEELNCRVAQSLTFTPNGTVGDLISPYVIEFFTTANITATANPTAGGTVSGDGVYSVGEIVTLTAIADEYYRFVNWTENDVEVSTSGTYSFTAFDDRNLVANFEIKNHWVPDESLYADNMSVVGEIQINGITQTSGDIEIGAFCGEEVRGSQRISYTPAPVDKYLVFLTIYGEPNDDITFKLYNHQTGSEYDLTAPEPITFAPNATVGGLNTPHILNFCHTQSRELTAGWNWYSTCIDIEGEDGFNMLTAGLGEDGLQVKSQSQFALYYPEYDIWTGSLNEADNHKLYMIQMSSPHTLVMTGAFTDVESTPITINKGWTWIGYPVTQNMSLDEATSNVSPSNGDYFKSQSGFSIYYEGYGWAGSLNTLEPGHGYMYQNNGESSMTLVYPTPGAKGTLEENVTADGNHWIPNAYQYADNMSVVAVINIDGVEQSSENLEVAAFCDGECRGSARPIYVEAVGRYMLFMTVYGEGGENLDFRLFDAGDNEEYQLQTSMVFEPNGTAGNLVNPYVFDLSVMGIGEEQPFAFSFCPNPISSGSQLAIEGEYDKIEIMNSTGVVICEYTNTNEIEITMIPGVYYIRVINDKSIIINKLVVK